MTGQALWPVADHREQWFADTHPGTPFDRVEKVVLHSTEGTGWPSYASGAVAPHFTCRPDFKAHRLVWRQHFPATRSARALRNPAGGVETNLDGAIQVEIVGTCDRAAAKKWPGHFLRMWDLPGWAVDGLGEFVRWCHVEHGVPLRAPAEWPAYGSGRSARMAGPVFDAFRGVLGHMHVPENTHGDPGDIDIVRIIEAAGDDVNEAQVKAAVLEVLQSGAGRRAVGDGVLGHDSVPNEAGKTPAGKLLTPRTLLAEYKRDLDATRTDLGKALAELAAVKTAAAEQARILRAIAARVGVTQ